MTQREWRGIDGTAGLGYWTHEPDGSLPLAQLERRSHGHLHKGWPLYIQTYTYICIRITGYVLICTRYNIISKVSTTCFNRKFKIKVSFEGLFLDWEYEVIKLYNSFHLSICTNTWRSKESSQKRVKLLSESGVHASANAHSRSYMSMHADPS